MECEYRIRAKWPANLCTEVKEKVAALFRENTQTYDLWQTLRENTNLQMRAEFWSSLEKNFPSSAEFCKVNGFFGGPTEKLCGNFDFGQSNITDVDDLFGNTPILDYKAASVWHMADWDALAKYLESLGATKVIWDSEENQDEVFSLYRYDEIVEQILEKALLPTLIGIHPDLDELIEEKLQKK